MAEESAYSPGDKLPYPAPQSQPIPLPDGMQRARQAVLQPATPGDGERIAGYQADGTPVFVPITDMEAAGDTAK